VRPASREKHEAVRAALAVAGIVGVFFAISALAGFYGSRHPSIDANAPVYAKPILHVEGFELRYEGLRPFIFPFLDRGYVVWANYPYFIYQGDTYERAGVGGVIVRYHQVRPTRYLVQETIEQADPLMGGPRWSRLDIIDKQDHKVVAARTLREGEVENHTGWVGQYAAEYVRKILVPDAPIGKGGIGEKSYPQVPVDIEQQAAGLTPALAPGSTCGPSIKRMNDSSWPAVGTARWSFLPQGRQLYDFACSQGYVMTLTSCGGDGLCIDVLTADGTYLFQTEFARQALSHDILVRLDKVSLSASLAEFDVVGLWDAHTPDEKRPGWQVHHRVHVRVPIAGGTAK
jgi:hypothetical protein